MMTNNMLFIIALAIMIILIIICFILSMINSSKINTLLDYSEDGDIISALKDYYDRVTDLSKTINDSSDAILSSRISNCENMCGLALSKTAAVNFDAYDDVTGKLSFALTLLNSNNDGIILTSLYGHNSCNTYVREIRGGQCSTKLLDEERHSLEIAKKGMNTGDDSGEK